MTEQTEPRRKGAKGRKWTEEERRKRAETWDRKREEKAIRKALEEKRNPPPPPPPGPKKWAANSKNPPQLLGLGETEEDKEMITRLLGELRSARKHERVYNDDDLEKALDQYFDECQQNGVIPTVEEMYLYIGYTRRWGNDIRNGRYGGFSPRTVQILERVHEMLAAFDAKLVMTGKVHPTNYIFRSKNFHGMRDEQQVNVSAGFDEQKKISADEIAKRYLNDVGGNLPKATEPVETTFKE